jgi:tetratricopeptide (TPR) repeat protein
VEIYLSLVIIFAIHHNLILNPAFYSAIIKALMLSYTAHVCRIAHTVSRCSAYEETLSVLRAIPQEDNPALVGHQLAWALFNLGRKAEASATLEQLLKDHPEDSGGLFTSVQAVLAASAGQERIAENKIKLAVEKGKGFGHFHHTAYHIACAYALMNKPEQAIKWRTSAGVEIPGALHSSCCYIQSTIGRALRRRSDLPMEGLC